MDNVNHPLVLNTYVNPGVDFIVITRQRTEMHYGNPFSHLGTKTSASVIVGTREEAVQAFEDWLDGVAWITVEPKRRLWILDHISELTDRYLGCVCAPKLCHGTPLAIRANT